MNRIPLVATLAALLASPAAAEGFKSMAKELSRAARKAGISRVAVLAFSPADSSRPGEGWAVSERLVTQLVMTGGVQAVERSLLRQLMEEHHLGRTGALDPTALQKLGRIFSAEGVVTGSFVTLGRQVKVNARLIEVETGLIVGASEREAEREWFDLPGLGRGAWAGGSEWLFVPAPELDVEPPALKPAGFWALKDSVADTADGLAASRPDAFGRRSAEDPCAGAAAAVDRLESRILDLKARYWAGRLKGGLSLASLKANPGSTISDPELKARFYDRLKAWHSLERVPELSPAEVKRFVDVDSRAYELHRECGL